MIEFVETLRYIPLDEPGRSCPLMIDFSERGVTSSFWSKSV